MASTKITEFYIAQGLLDDSLLACLQQELPVVVRINKTRSCGDQIYEILSRKANWHEVSWFPGQCVFQCDPISFAEDESFKKWLSEQNKSYTIRFQEAVSLLPPLLLDLANPNLSVLDMCAAPGSKTLLCMESLSQAKQENYCLIANEVDARRCQRLLPLILRRACSTGVVITMGDARKFPVLFSQEKNSEGEINTKQFLFDRILADVPCSGDGTLRKNPEIWDTWSNEYALGLHCKQLRILQRGLHMLQENGILVYSTCSMNPIENEAVVSTILKKFGESIECLDSHQRLRNILTDSFQLSEGVSNWKVPNYTSNSFFTSYEDVPEQLRKQKGGLITESMFPCTPTRCEELSHCIRVYPHANNTGGFFIATFRKRSHRITEDSDLHPAYLPKQISWRGRNPNNVWSLLKDDSEVRLEIERFYELRKLPDHLHLLSEHNIKGNMNMISVVSSSALNLLQSRFQGKIKGPQVVFVGLPLFKRLDDNFVPFSTCRWRPTLESGELLSKQMTRRILLLHPSALQEFLLSKSLPITYLRELTKQGRMTGLESCQEKIGPVLVGVLDTDKQACKYSDVWIPAVITGKQILLFGRSSELQHISLQLNPGDPAELQV